MAAIKDKLKTIIQNTQKSPTIVNEKSNFVVVTYWWGRGNLNANTARPCISFFETDFITKIIKFWLVIINTSTKNVNENEIAAKINKIFESYKKGKTYAAYEREIAKMAKKYMETVYTYCKIDLALSSEKKDELALAFLEKLKQSQNTPSDYEYKTSEYVISILKMIMKYAVLMIQTELIKLYIINKNVLILKGRYQNTDKTNVAEIENIKQEIEKNKLDKKNTLNAISVKLKTKIPMHPEDSGFNDAKYNNTNIYDILNMEFRYLSPIKFEDMISRWESECEKHNCNYLSVEYPEFALPGGYQMAINAKPLFIKKSLELCIGRNILYIDGDMYIRKYPTIFDMTDVDFMARGWNIDPRSSDRLEESIMYDPYVFETSGGTMFFGQSKESKVLIDKWNQESDKPYNEGKADDRILSLVFNTQKFLCNMKIIQLPIEYLWLSLAYDEGYLLENSYYDYNFAKIKQSIFIEHPECLTSEETASGSGASSDRLPKFHGFLDAEPQSAVSESMHEYIFFPNKEMTSAFRDYFDFMTDITYIDDGNEDLIRKGFVNPEDPFASESPLYITKYDDKYGNQKHSSGEVDEEGKQLTVNEAVNINIESANNIQITPGDVIKELQENMVEISGDYKKENGKPDQTKILRLVLKLLKEGKSVLYNPTHMEGYDESYYTTLMSKIDIYKNLDFVFAPQIDSFVFNETFKPKIQINKPMLFCPGNDILIKFLPMFFTLDELSGYLNYGSYEFMSRIRVGYLYKKRNVGKMVVGGGQEDGDNFFTEYEEGLESMYSPKRSGGKKTIKKRTKHKYSKKRRLTRRRK